jgi:hypothetical protein
LGRRRILHLGAEWPSQNPKFSLRLLRLIVNIGLDGARATGRALGGMAHGCDRSSAVVQPLQRCIARHQRRLVAGAQQLSRSPVPPGRSGKPKSANDLRVCHFSPKLPPTPHTRLWSGYDSGRSYAPSQVIASMALGTRPARQLARSSERAVGAGASGLIDRPGHC